MTYDPGFSHGLRGIRVSKHRLLMVIAGVIQVKLLKSVQVNRIIMTI